MSTDKKAWICLKKPENVSFPILLYREYPSKKQDILPQQEHSHAWKGCDLIVTLYAVLMFKGHM